MNDSLLEMCCKDGIEMLHDVNEDRLCQIESAKDSHQTFMHL